MPEVAVGLVLMVGFSLAAVLWHMNSTQRDPVVALAVDVRRGDVLESADLRTVYLASDDPVAHVEAADADDLVGRVATADLEQGTLLTRAQVTTLAPIEAGEGVVGLALDPGQLPSTELLPGDLVNVVAPAGPNGGDRAGERTLAEDASVFAIEELEVDNRRVVSLRMPEEAANAVAAAAEQGGLHLVLVGS